MKITQLTQMVSFFADKARTLNFDEFNHELKVHGRFPKLGSGFFATVYDLPDSGYVLKVNGTLDGTYHWLRYCAQNAHKCPHLPRVLAVYELQERNLPKWNENDPNEAIRTRTGYIAVMEKLTPLKSRTIPNDQALAFQVIAYGRDRVVPECHNDRAENAQLIYDNVFRNDPELLELGFKIRDLISDLRKKPGTSASLDLHLGNIMARGNEFVITDPIC